MNVQTHGHSPVLVAALVVALAGCQQPAEEDDEPQANTFCVYTAAESSRDLVPKIVAEDRICVLCGEQQALNGCPGNPDTNAWLDLEDANGNAERMKVTQDRQNLDCQDICNAEGRVYRFQD